MGSGNARGEVGVTPSRSHKPVSGRQRQLSALAVICALFGVASMAPPAAVALSAQLPTAQPVQVAAALSATPTPPIIPVPSPLLPVRSVINGSFESPQRSGNGHTFYEALNGTQSGGELQLEGWQTTHPRAGGRDHPIEVWAGPLNYNGRSTAFDGRQRIELNAFRPAAIYQDVCVLAGESVSWSVQHRARGVGQINTMEVTISDPAAWSGTTPPASVGYRSGTLTSLPGQNDGTGTNGWLEHTGTWAGGPATTGPQRFAFGAIEGSFGRVSFGNLIDDVGLDLPPTIEFVDPDVTNNVNQTRPAADGNFYVTFAVSGAFTAAESIQVASVGAVPGTDYTVSQVFDGAGTPRSDVGVAVAGNGNIELTMSPGVYDPNNPADYVTVQIEPSLALAARLDFEVELVNPSAGLRLGDAECMGTETPVIPLAVAPTGDLSIAKTSSGFAGPGGPITYTLTVRSEAGSAPAVGAIVRDTFTADVLGATWTCAASSTNSSCSPSGLGDIADTVTIVAGDELVYTVTGTVAALAGDVENIATIEEGPNFLDADPSNNSSSVLESPTLSDLSVTKVDSVDPVVAGSTLTYTIAVSNDGPAEARNVITNDALPAGVTLVSTSGCSQDPFGAPGCSLGDLAVGASVSYDVTVQIDPAATGPLRNEVSVSSNSGDPVPDNNTAVELTDVAAPSIRVIKTVLVDGASCPGIDGRTLLVAPGVLVQYCYEVINDGAVALTDVVVEDAALGLTGAAGLVVPNLAPGASQRVESPVRAAATLLNTADVRGTPADDAFTPLPGLGPITASETAALAIATPGVELAKTVTAAGSCAGSEDVFGVNGLPITYCFAVSNAGDAPLDLGGMRFSDPTLGATEADLVPAPTGVLAPGATATFEIAATLTATELNTASIIIDAIDNDGAPLPGAAALEATDTASTTLAAPSVNVTKSIVSGHDGGASCAGVASDALSLAVGAPVTYCFEVTNGSDVAGLQIEVVDPQLDASFPAGVDGVAEVLVERTPAPAFLPAGDTASFFFETIATADIINEVTARGLPTDAAGVPLPGGVADTATDTSSLDVVDPGIQVVKTASTTNDCSTSQPLVSVPPNAQVWFCFEITNMGDTALTDVVLTDPLLPNTAGGLVVPGLLLAGDSIVVSSSIPLSVDTTNVVTVRGHAATDLGAPMLLVPPVTAGAQADVDVVTPGLTVSKTVYEGHDAGAQCPSAEQVIVNTGTNITFCFEVTNTGDTTLADIEISDPALGLTLIEPGPLVPGATVVRFVETTSSVTLPNNASASGLPVASDGSSLGLDRVDASTPDPATVIVPPGQLVLEKSVMPGPALAADCGSGTDLLVAEEGTNITFCFALTNAGGQPVEGISIVDLPLGLEGTTAVAVGRLEPGASIVVTADAVMTNDLTNSATARGTDATGVVVQSRDTARVERPADTGGGGDDGGSGGDGSLPVTGSMPWQLLLAALGLGLMGAGLSLVPRSMGIGIRRT